tara:strand:- start:12153 stop:12971 length:819 start_codon:yes stop_codon:yes gene_type:complete
MLIAYIPTLQSEDFGSDLFSKVRQPNIANPEAIGSYSKGCLSGGSYIPNSKFYDQLRPSRNRYWGHPNLLEFIDSIAKEMHDRYGNGLLLGDLSMPRGGPMPYGHKSHQNGLDVDIFYEKKPNIEMQRYELESYKPSSILSANQETVNLDIWSDYHYQLLKVAAEHSEVSRIFVNPVIKRKLCNIAEGRNDKDWLYKIRPWGGHYNHFHVRLNCPASSPECINQRPVEKYHSCGNEINYWLNKDKVYESGSTEARKWLLLSNLPKSCNKLVE